MKKYELKWKVEALERENLDLYKKINEVGCSCSYLQGRVDVLTAYVNELRRVNGLTQGKQS